MNFGYECKIYADFETTVTGEADQKETEVWSAAWITDGNPAEPEYVHVEHSLDDFINVLDDLPCDARVYFHNLKFDGTFILTYFLKNNKKWKPEYTKEGWMAKTPVWKMKRHHFKYTISDKGVWYSLTFKNKHNYTIAIWDSLKLVPMSLASLGEAFKTKHQKLEMEYTGDHYPGCYISPEELAYIKNDVLVLKEVMQAMDEQGIDAMTIGSACMKEYKLGLTDEQYNRLFPDLTKVSVPDYSWHDENTMNRSADDFIRESYKGGFCYCSPHYAGKVLPFVSHADANSHYPSQMHSNSGNYFPVGLPEYYRDEDIPDQLNKPKDVSYYFIRFSCSFQIKPKHIPMIQLKHDIRFMGRRNEWLESSDGLIVDMTMTRTDFEQFLDSYEVKDLHMYEMLSFQVAKGMFDKYIDHWMGIKMKSKGAIRQIAKLFLNNLYGQFSKSMDSSYKIAEYIPGKGLVYHRITAYDKTPGYIAIGSAITSYARHVTTTIAQDNYDYFVYADTDSVVMTIPEKDIKGLPIDPVKLCYWKVESNSDASVFVRQKTYIEHVTHEDGNPVEPYYNVKCAGMGKGPKEKVVEELNNGTMKLEDFHVGFTIDGNLKAKSVDGGTLLVNSLYKMH